LRTAVDAVRRWVEVSRWFGVAVLVFALLAAACNSGTNTTPTATALSATATPADDSTPLQTQTLSDWYSIGVPVGWEPEDIGVPGGFVRRYVLTQDGVRKAQLTLQCQPGASISTMMQLDARTIRMLKGQYGIGGSQPVTVGGLSGLQTDYEAVAGILIDTHAVYLQGKVCGWRILLQAYGAGEISKYRAMFERVLPTFQLFHPEG
jgi:hypothetical protein